MQAGHVHIDLMDGHPDCLLDIELDGVGCHVGHRCDARPVFDDDVQVDIDIPRRRNVPRLPFAGSCVMVSANPSAIFFGASPTTP